MKKKALTIVMLLVFCGRASAFDWAANNLTVLSSDEEKGIGLKDDRDRLFFILNHETATSGHVDRIRELVSVFYGWEHANIRELTFIVEEDGIRIILYPKTIQYQGTDLLPFLTSGMMFFDQEEELQYNFRIVSDMMFLRIQGVYASEDALLKKIEKAVNDGRRHIEQNDPDYLISKIKSLEEQIKEMKSDIEKMKQADARLKQADAKLKDADAKLTDKDARFDDSLARLKDSHEVWTNETVNLRQAVLDIHRKKICPHGGDALDDSIISVMRYPGDLARKTQAALINYGKNPGPINNRWGYLTYRALLEFQKENPLLEVTGELDEMTGMVLFHSNLWRLDPEKAKLFQSPADWNFDDVREERFVMQIRIALLNKGRMIKLTGEKPNILDIRELIKYQHHDGLVPSGELDEKTLEKLFGDNMGSILGKVKEGTKIPNDLARNIQIALLVKGYDVGEVDSLWGGRSARAIAKFQMDEKTFITGEPDPETIKRLFDGEVCNYVEKVQAALREKDCYQWNIDGKWGPRTEKAIKAFQFDENLESSGRIDIKTKAKLFFK